MRALPSLSSTTAALDSSGAREVARLYELDVVMKHTDQAVGRKVGVAGFWLL